ncbi:MAG: amidohydrolase [Acetatifactor sp.]|nr:amidohydrolase [Acetatifactor sp.]
MERIFYNGRIITMENETAEEELAEAPEAVLVRDGLIAAVGSLEEVLELAGDEAVKCDLKGKCLMPSFIDAHSHFVMNGQMASWADLSACESFEDIIAVLRAYIGENHITDKDVILGFGYDHNFLREGMQPDKRVLDVVSSTIPIFILHISAHLACANSAALRLARIDETTPNPEGGVIGRLDGGEPSGYVEEAGMNLLQRAILPRVNIDYEKMLWKMQEVYIDNGITTVQDGASTESDINALLNMSASKALKLDVVAYPLMSSGGAELMQKYGEAYKQYVNGFKIGGYKLVLDGSPQGRSAWMSEPYLGDEPDYCGYPWMKDEEVQAYVGQAVSESRQLLAHCNGDAASEQFIRAYEKADKTGKDGLRPVMIHCQTVRNDQLDRMAKLHMIASIFIGHVWYWGDIHIKNFGPQRGNHVSPAKDAIDRGVMINFHQDTPVTRPDMLHSVWCAVNRISRGGSKIGEDQAISVYEALKAITINGAYQYFEEDQKGSIAKGKRADLVILDRSPLETDPMEIRDIKVLETIKDGETISRKREMI